MFSFDSLAYVTLSDGSGYLSLHAMPLESLLQVLIHLGSSGVDGIRGFMSFLQDQILELNLAGYANVIPNPHNPLLIL